MSTTGHHQGHSPGREIATGELWVVVPVKPLALSKQRLKDCLGPLRPGLTEAMLDDVLGALARSGSVSGVIVVTMDAGVAALAEARGASVVEEAGPYGMNRAIGQGLAAARRRGATRLAAVPVDIPLLTGREFDRLVREWSARLKASAGPVLGIVPSGDAEGTNWICFGADLDFEPAYGPGSFHRHLGAVRRRGHQAVTLVSPRVSLDIDEAADLDSFLDYCDAHPASRPTKTWRFLRGLNRNTVSHAPVQPGDYDESKYAISNS